APQQRTSSMQCAARSIPPQRSLPARRSSMSFEPTLSVEAASSCRSLSGKRPAKRPKPVAPVDSTAARRRSTTAFAVSSETPAASYVRASFVKWSSLGSISDEHLRFELGPPLRAAGCEADEGLADLDLRADPPAVEELRDRCRLPFGIVRFQVELGEAETVRLAEQLVDPVAGRMKLQPIARVRGHERAPPAVLLHPELRLLGAAEGAVELVLVEGEAEVVDARQRPLSRLHDDVDGAELELREPELEPGLVQLRPRHPGLERLEVFADAAVPRDEVETELADVARLDLADAARDEVVVEQVHSGRWYEESQVPRRSRVGSMRSAGIHHVDLVVSSIERSLPFYRDLLGPLGWHRIGEVEGERGETIWYLSGPGTSIGLREAQSDERAVDRYAIGLHHLAIEAASREAVDERAEWVRG